jgi:hypothetical protein
MTEDVSCKLMIGKVVLRVVEVHDYFQILFVDGSVLSVFNRSHWINQNLDLGVKGASIQNVQSSEEKIQIEFSNGAALVVGLTNDDYFGPEAMTFDVDGGQTIVWN